METRRKITGKISIVGHRGAPDCAPENTLASFREGLRQGADLIELDVQLTALTLSSFTMTFWIARLMGVDLWPIKPWLS